MLEPLDSNYLIMGYLGAPFGIQGYHWIQSFTVPVENILELQPWYLSGKKLAAQPQAYTIDAVHRLSKGLAVKLKGVEDRTQAGLLKGATISVLSTMLPVLPKGEYYWAELYGLAVVTLSGELLGNVASLYTTGAHDNMIVKANAKERHIPFVIPDVVKQVDLAQQSITVDWDPDY
jgi:16S rRNA processing protein RimM